MNQSRKEDAVSPVVGIMLMLVVTIVIATVITMFAGGIADNSDAASNVVIKFENSVVETIGYGGDPYSGYYYDSTIDVTDPGNAWYTNTGLYGATFMHNGGETLQIDDLHLVMTVAEATFSAPVSQLTDKETWSAGQTLVLSILDDVKDGNYDYNKPGVTFETSELVLGLTKQSLTHGPVLDWVITDASGYVIAKGSAPIEN